MKAFFGQKAKTKKQMFHIVTSKAYRKDRKTKEESEEVGKMIEEKAERASDNYCLPICIQNDCLKPKIVSQVRVQFIALWSTSHNQIEQKVRKRNNEKSHI